MTQEQKEILIKDICCRLPYGVKIQTDYTDIKILEGIQFPNYIGISDGYYSLDDVECKPYLFPMSSMNEEQKEEYSNLLDDILDDFGHSAHFDTIESIDWLYEHHFDIHSLIPIGLAIDCTNLNIY
jgi:hypothetical protein